MIVKIWPIHGDHAKTNAKSGGTKGLKNALDYIMDEEKVIARQEDLKDMNILDEEAMRDEDRTSWGRNEHRVLRYMADEDKMEGKYITGYLCDPELAIEQFQEARRLTLERAGVERPKEKGAVAFHLVQSFPEYLDISDEEVHQCGLELCQKIGLHQAVVCSHVHPVTDENGEIHGKCKHNHILINAYIHPDKLDLAAPNQLKYNDGKRSYAQLQIWNDEIAIDHGLPIIRNPDYERSYSWTESNEKSKGQSWKEQIRMDIEEARRACGSWTEFVALMEQNGYTIKEGTHVTYTAPDGVHAARGKTLGREYTKESLELFWSVRDYSRKAVEQTIQDHAAPPLSDLIRSAKAPLFAAVPLGIKGQAERTYYYLALEENQHNNKVLETYFNSNELYDICDGSNRPIAAATGQEILDCIELFRDSVTREEREQAQEDAKRKREQDKKKEKNYAIYTVYINSRTKQPYRSPLYDEHGRRRSVLELLLLLAITVLQQEGGLWEARYVPPGRENEPIFGPIDQKIQRMHDAISAAREEKIETPGQLDQQVHEAGAALSRARSALQKVSRAKEKMETLKGAISDYRETKDVAERILNLEEGPQKETLKQQCEDALSRYRVSKAVLYRYQVTEEHQIAEFETRYAKIDEDIRALNERFDMAKEKYRRLKKLEYSVALAQNAQYCYGPAYTYDHAYREEQKRKPERTEHEHKTRSLDELLRETSGEKKTDRQKKENERETDGNL